MYLCGHSLFLGRDKEDMSSLKTGPSRLPFPSSTLAYSGQPGSASLRAGSQEASGHV